MLWNLIHDPGYEVLIRIFEDVYDDICGNPS